MLLLGFVMGVGAAVFARALTDWLVPYDAAPYVGIHEPDSHVASPRPAPYDWQQDTD